jgi:hypothetical protein
MKNFKLIWVFDTFMIFMIFLIFMVLVFGFEYFFKNFILLLFSFFISQIFYDYLFKEKEYRFNALRTVLYMKFKNHNKSKEL